MDGADKKFSPWDATTLDLFVKRGKALRMSHDRLQLKTKLDNGVIIPYRGIVNKYHGAFTRFIRDYTFNDEDFRKYQYCPKLFCRETYGTPELWSELLYINHMTSMMEFNKRTIKAFSMSILDNISELTMLYRDDLIDNRVSIGEVYV